MDQHPKAGTNQAVHATFRLIPHGSKGSCAHHKNSIMQCVMLELFDLPEMVVVHQGATNGLIVSAASRSHCVFRVVAGLDGSSNSISLEAVDQKGCFVYSDGRNVQLLRLDDGVKLKAGAIFNMLSGLREYHPICFTAKGVRRNFLLGAIAELEG